MPKYALITGASSGIGYNLAIAFSTRGYTVFACAPKLCVHEMEPLVKRYGVKAFAMDITNPAEIRAGVEYFRSETGEGKLDVLYNNAGIAIGGPGFYFDDDEVINFMNINLTGHMLVTKYFADFVIEAKGTIVYTSLVAAKIPLAWTSIYCASKAGIDTYAKGIRAELAPFGVRVHSVITGGVRTEIAKKATDKMTTLGETQLAIPGLQESMDVTAAMTAGGMRPEVYAERIAKRICSRYSGFNIYEGKLSGVAKFLGGWVPLWLQYYIMAIRFKQFEVFRSFSKMTRTERAVVLARD